MAASQISSLSVLFARLSWMMLGPIALFLLISAIIRSQEGWMTIADMAFFGVIAGMVLCRFIEFRSGEARTASGDPMSASKLWRYVVGMIVLGVAAWVVANVIAQSW